MSYENKIKFSEDFTDMPIGRYRSEGSHSGEVFREDHLIPALELYGDDVVTVDLSDIYGMGGSFMDEAFGGLIRENGYTANDILERLEIVGDDFLKEEIEDNLKFYFDYKKESEND